MHLALVFITMQDGGLALAVVIVIWQYTVPWKQRNSGIQTASMVGFEVSFSLQIIAVTQLHVSSRDLSEFLLAFFEMGQLKGCQSLKYLGPPSIIVSYDPPHHNHSPSL